MTPLEKKANLGITLVICFAVTLISGVILHLKKHGIIVEPRPVIKMLHWVVGFLMTALAVWHYAQFRPMLRAMKARFKWFWTDSWGVAILLAVTSLTGLVKLLTPVKIPHLGLWHYAIGLVMAAFVVVHLFRALPSWWRMMRARSPR